MNLIAFTPPLRSKKNEKEREADEGLQAQGLDAISHTEQVLCNWQIEGPMWNVQDEPHPIILQACPAGVKIARCVWSFFKKLTWRHPDLPLTSSDYGITWNELAIHFSLFACRCMPIWLKVKENQPAHPFDFDSPEVSLQKPELRSLWHQATNLRNVVQYLESTSTMHLYPRYAKTGLSTMVRLGYHRSLVGRIASRPCLPQRDLAMQILKDYSSTPGQPYPLNVRLPFVPNLDSSAIEDAMPSELPFMKRHNLYQRVKKMLTT